MTSEAETKRAKVRRKPKAEGVYWRTDSPLLWIQYSINGRRFRECANTTLIDTAKDRRSERLAAYKQTGAIEKDVQKIMFVELWELIATDYQNKNNKSFDDLKGRYDLHIKPFFECYRASQISSDAIRQYVNKRRERKASHATINRELAIVKRMLRLGMSNDPPKVLRIPKIEMLKESKARAGFVDEARSTRSWTARNSGFVRPSKSRFRSDGVAAKCSGCA